MKAVFSSSVGAMGIWWYPEKASRKESILCPVVESTIWSIRSRGKLSFRHALLRLVWSTHTLYFPSFLGTTTTFASQFGYSTSLTNPASNNFSTSSQIIFCLSGWNRLTFCRTGFDEGKMLSLWKATEGWIPVMLECAHAKISWFCRRVSWIF